MTAQVRGVIERRNQPPPRPDTAAALRAPEAARRDLARLKEEIRARARDLGFDAVGFAPPDLPGATRAAYRAYIAAGRHGDMEWLARTPERRETPRGLWPEVRSVVVLAVNYGPDEDPRPLLEQRDRANVSVYARNRDYHDLIKKRLKQLASWLHEKHGAQVKVFVDTAPVLEKPLAQLAGVGWQGKHSNLVSRGFGSWLFLGEVFTDVALPPDEPERDRCGSCRACLDVCPTAAFPAPYQLDARRCLSYLTIEHKGHVPAEFREPMGNRIYGCDDCLAVCPWNKFASESREAQLKARDDLRAPPLAELARLDDGAFRARFSGSPIKRIGRDRFVRNVLIAVGNSGEPALAAVAGDLLDDPSPLVRAMAVWALGRLLDDGAFAGLRAGRIDAEPDPAVRDEWRRAGPVAAGRDHKEGGAAWSGS